MNDLRLIVVTFLLNVAMELVPHGHPRAAEILRAIGAACVTIED